MPKKPAGSLTENLPIPVEIIERRIYLIRGHKVMLDSDLAELYQVTTGNLNLAVKRNADGRFPARAAANDGRSACEAQGR